MEYIRVTKENIDQGHIRYDFNNKDIQVSSKKRDDENAFEDVLFF